MSHRSMSQSVLICDSKHWQPFTLLESREYGSMLASTRSAFIAQQLASWLGNVWSNGQGSKPLPSPLSTKLPRNISSHTLTAR